MLLEALFLLLVPLSFPPLPEEEKAEAPPRGRDGVLDAIEALDSLPLEDLWSALDKLRASFPADQPEGLKELAEKVHGLPPTAKLAGAAYLFTRKHVAQQRTAQVALQQLARGDAPKPVRLAAIRLLRHPVRPLEASLTLKDLIDAAADPEIQIEASVALWELDNHQSVRLPLIRLLDHADAQVRFRAALALARTGYFQTPVEGLLRKLREEPSERGQLAELLLESMDRESARLAGRTQPGPGVSPGSQKPVTPDLVGPPWPTDNGAGNGRAADGWPSLLLEVEQLILRHSVHRDQLDVKALFVAALEGMAASLDEYSAFQEPEDVQAAEATRLGVYWGLGADLVKPGRSSPLVVSKPHRGGPAFTAGIRSGDRILEVNGVTTHDRDRFELERLTARDRDAGVHLLVSRWGWPAPRMFALERRQVELPTLENRLLAARIGYVRLLRFGPNTAAELERALDALEAQGLQALVLDLRDNPGGNLRQARNIADLFVGTRAEPIVTEVAPGRKSEFFSSAEEKPRHPMTILVNHGSASASEVVAGALQDFGRAVIIGEPTYGKGMKVSSFPLSAEARALLEGDGRLLLTTAYLLRPSGRSLQPERGKDGRLRPGGVEPDIRIKGREMERAQDAEEAARVQYSPEMDRYIHDHREVLTSRYEDNGLEDALDFPQFEALAESLGTRLPVGSVRQAVRSRIRQRIEEETTGEVKVDIREDRQLQRALLEVLRRLEIDATTVPEYRHLPEAHLPEAPASSRE